MRKLVAVLFAVVLGTGFVVAGPTAQALAATSNGDIVFSDDNANNDLYMVHDDGTGTRRLTFSGDAHNPAWSPDGQSVAYDHAGDVWVLRLGQKPRRVTSNGQSFDPVWSPDGTRLAYSRAVRLYLRDIFVVPAAGGSSTRVSWMAKAGCTDVQPAWAPNSAIFYVRESAIATCTEGIYRQQIGQAAQLAVADPFASEPQVSTDNQHLVFLAPCDPNDCNGDEGWMTTLAGGNRRAVTPDHYYCAEGELCLETVVNAPAGGWVGAGTFADVDANEFVTCYYGGHFVNGVVVDNAPQFCLPTLAYDFDIRAA
jgi:dipeptidyl aminopeptidase/acylaminoacyl peptidase